MKTCAFCNEVADSKEHVIPQWLQRQYNLKDQKLGLWNGTSIKYSQAIIPACKYCNSVRFGRLENKVRLGKATKQEYYLWALKIRYGLALRDSTLLLDRSNPEKGSILPKELENYGVEFIKHAFKALDNPEYTFHPSPFGSVFLFKQSDKTKGTFGLVDVPPPYWGLSIVVPADKVLMVLFADRGAVRKCLSRHFKGKGGIDALSDHIPELEPRTLTFSILRWQNHLIIPDDVRLTENALIGRTPPKRIRIRKQKMQWYLEIANHCGLTDEVAREAYQRDLAMLSVKSIKCV